MLNGRRYYFKEDLILDEEILDRFLETKSVTLLTELRLTGLKKKRAPKDKLILSPTLNLHRH